MYKFNDRCRLNFSDIKKSGSLPTVAASSCVSLGTLNMFFFRDAVKQRALGLVQSEELG